MASSIYRPILIGLVVLLAIALPLPIIQVRPVQATTGCPLTGASCCPPLIPCFDNPWAPYGPETRNLQMKYYSSPFSEINDFLTGHLDVGDSPTPRGLYSLIDSNPDFLQSPAQGQFGFFGIYFNGASSRFSTNREYDAGAPGPFWGCNWNSGIPFTSSAQTYVSQCGIDMRQSFLHLVDRPAFARNQGDLAAIVDPSPPAKDPSASPLSSQCSWDQLYPSSTYPTCLGADNFADDPSGFATAGSLDFCAAADHLILAGVASGKQSGTCVLTGVNPGVFAHPLRFFPRNNDPARFALGMGWMNAMNQLFGGTAVIAPFGTIINPGPIVFFDPPEGIMDDWDAYTYGYNIPGPYVDHLDSLFNSLGASDFCGGPQNGSPSNPTFVCIRQLDTAMQAAMQTPDLSTYRTDTLAAFNIYGSHAVDMPVFSRGIRTVGLTSVAGLVDQVGVGYPNPWTTMNGHVNPNYVPSDPIYAFGGGDPNALRWGQAQPTLSLSVFQAQSVWEFQALHEVYDTLFVSSPAQPASIFCWICNSYTRSIDSNGDTHYLVTLKTNLRWHDGVPVDAKDIKFSLLNTRDYAVISGNLPSTLKAVNVFSPSILDIVFNGRSFTLQTVLTTPFIIPRHIWELSGDLTYGDVGRVDPAKLDFSFDPITQDAFIGSGPFACVSTFPEDLGRVGTGCAKLATGGRSGQTIPVGGSMTLRAFDFTSQSTDPFYQYMRSFNTAWGTGTGDAAESGQFQEFSYSDGPNRDAVVDISDVSSVAVCFGANPANNYNSGTCGSSGYNYWDRSAFETTPGTIGIGEVAIVTAHYGDQYVFPYTWNPSTLIAIVPYQ